jgi:hypothetical protein
MRGALTVWTRVPVHHGGFFIGSTTVKLVCTWKLGYETELSTAGSSSRDGLSFNICPTEVRMCNSVDPAVGFTGTADLGPALRAKLDNRLHADLAAARIVTEKIREICAIIHPPAKPAGNFATWAFSAPMCTARVVSANNAQPLNVILLTMVAVLLLILCSELRSPRRTSDEVVPRRGGEKWPSSDIQKHDGAQMSASLHTVCTWPRTSADCKLATVVKVTAFNTLAQYFSCNHSLTY